MVNSEASKATILIVDDIPDTVQLLKDWLETHDFKAIGETSSIRALDVAEREKPDLILMDVMMPKMDGMETCRRLKANPKTANIPVIIVTAKNPSDARAEGMMAGAVDYIAKPVNLHDLVKRIEIALATTAQSPVDVQRLLEEVAHSTLAILSVEMVWLLGTDSENAEQILKSRSLVTTSGARIETDFLLTAGNGQPIPTFSLQDDTNLMVSALLTRNMRSNVPTEKLKEDPSTQPIFKATEMLRLNYLTVLPLTVAGKTPGVMLLGTVQPMNMESPRARQILTSLGSQAAIAMDYSRLITDLSERENEMRREQNYRQMILDTMSDGLVVIDSKGTIKYVNRRLLRMTNHPKGYLENRSVGELFHPDDRVEVMIGLLREGAATMKFDQRIMTRENRVIPVWLTRSRAQSDDLNNQVIVLSDMTDQKLREEELERQSSRLTALNQAAHIITSNLSLSDTLNNILSAAMKVVRAQGASVFLLDRENPDELIVVAAVGSGSEILRGMRVPVGEGVAGWVAREAKSQLVGDIEQDSRFYRGVDEQTGISTQSLIAVPLINSGQVIGVVEVVNKLGGEHFRDNDVNLLEGMAGTAAVSIVNARLFDETKRRVNELGILLNASDTASSTLQFSDVLEGIARNLSEGLRVARCSIMAWNAPKNRLESLAELGDVGWENGNAPRHALAGEPNVSLALRSRQPVAISLLDTSLSNENRDHLNRSGLISILTVPLTIHDAVVGLAQLCSSDPRTMYSQQDAEQTRAVFELWQQKTGLTEITLEGVPGPALTKLVNQLMKVGRTTWVRLYAWQQGEDFARLLHEKGFVEWTRRAGTSMPIDKYPTLQAVVQDQNIRMVTLEEMPDDPAEKEWLEYRGGQSCMIVPLFQKGVTVGVVKLMSLDGRLFDQDEVRLAQGIANVVSNAMENARLYQSLDSRARALESAYKELQEADKAKDEFIQNVSHELRTPLISVLGYAGLLEDGSMGIVNDEQKEALHIIAQKGQKLADLVEDIVSVQALETRTYDRKPVDLGQVVKQVVEKYRQRAQDAGMRFNVRSTPNLPQVVVDPATVQDAFERLIDNSIKFGGSTETIDLVLQDTDGPMVQVMVRDSGIGIDASEHQKIFQRFYQVDGGVNRRYAGTGLGLAIAKAIIEGHGGRIGVKSKLNEGATFVFTLPKHTAMAQ